MACAFIFVGASTHYTIVHNCSIFEVDRLSSEVLTETVHQSRAQHSAVPHVFYLIVAVMALSEQELFTDCDLMLSFHLVQGH